MRNRWFVQHLIRSLTAARTKVDPEPKLPNVAVRLSAGFDVSAMLN